MRQVAFVLTLLLLGLAITPALARTSYHDQRPLGLSYDEAAHWATVFDQAWDAIPPDAKAKAAITTNEQLQAWTKEIVPYYGMLGIDDPTMGSGVGVQAPQGGMVYPSSVQFADYGDGTDTFFHVLGETNCLDHSVTLNQRMAASVSPWYGRPDALMTLTHELAHAQGVCWPGTTYDEETGAQLAAMEVLSAMAASNTDAATVALVDELRSMSLSAANWAARDEGRYSDYLVLRDKLADSVQEQAAYRIADRFWAARGHDYDEVLYSYNYVPMSIFVRLMDHPTQGAELWGSTLPRNWALSIVPFDDFGHTDHAPYWWTPKPMAQFTQAVPLKFDNLQFFLLHLDAFVQELQ